MTGLERMLAALSPEGAAEIPVINCYPGIFERDHFAALTDLPWWYLSETDLDRRVQLIESLAGVLDFDCFALPLGPSRTEQTAVKIVVEGDAVYQVRDSERRRLQPPVVSGTLSTVTESYPVIEDLEQFFLVNFPASAPFRQVEDGRDELPKRLLATLGKHLCPYQHVCSPLWVTAGTLGYEQWFTHLATEPERIYAGAERFLQHVLQDIKLLAAIGCRVIWIEECLTDQIGPRIFEQYNLPLLREITDAIRRAGMHSIYYFCGNPWPVWDLLLDSGADALALEESKKQFRIDIAEVAERLDGHMALLGNLDAIELLETAPPVVLRREVQRQLDAGRYNGNRFIMSTGSPITPGTSVERVREYLAMVRELGS